MHLKTCPIVATRMGYDDDITSHGWPHRPQWNVSSRASRPSSRWSLRRPPLCGLDSAAKLPTANL
eukprot:1729578-Pyramimonas_sp.AAC.1